MYTFNSNNSSNNNNNNNSNNNNTIIINSYGLYQIIVYLLGYIF